MSKKLIETIKIYLVDGEEIRNREEIEFELGGHHYVYPELIPENEIWLDDTVQEADDMVATLLHELCERTLMKHEDMTYDDAHEGIANGVEEVIRRELG